MKKVALAILALSFTVLSCKKDNKDNNPNPVNNNPTSFNEMKVADGFDWSTTRNVTVDVEGLSAMTIEVTKVMKVLDVEGNLLFKQVIDMDKDATLEFEAPASLEEVVIEYGAISETVEILNGRGDFSFVPVDDRSDLDPEDR